MSDGDEVAPDVAAFDLADGLGGLAQAMLSVRLVDGRPTPDASGMEPSGAEALPRTIAWSVGHLGDGSWHRADYLVGEHRIQPGDLTWPMTAAEGIAFMKEGLSRWRNGLDQMTDEDLDTIGRSAFPHGLDPQLPLIEIVWWVNKELLYRAGEIWLLRDMFAVHGGRPTGGA